MKLTDDVISALQATMETDFFIQLQFDQEWLNFMVHLIQL